VKQKDTEKKAELEQKQKEDLKNVEVEMQEKGIEGKNKIKDRFNELAKEVAIDTSEFVKALLKKKDVSFFTSAHRL
jgi:energy-converting hydrogenase A subunit M